MQIWNVPGKNEALLRHLYSVSGNVLQRCILLNKYRFYIYKRSYSKNA